MNNHKISNKAQRFEGVQGDDFLQTGWSLRNDFSGKNNSVVSTLNVGKMLGTTRNVFCLDEIEIKKNNADEVR